MRDKTNKIRKPEIEKSDNKMREQLEREIRKKKIIVKGIIDSDEENETEDKEK